MDIRMVRLLTVASLMYGEDDEKAKAEAALREQVRKDETEKIRKEEEEKFNKQSASARYGYKKELEKAAEEAKKLSEDKRLTQEERDSHAKRADDLEAQYKTEKELNEKAQKKIKEDADKRVKESEEKGNKYKKKYVDGLVETELAKATATAEEQVPGQLIKFLKPDTQLVEELGDDGKPTGNEVVKINFEDVDKDGKPVKLLLTPKETVKRMRELPEQYGNFFKGVGTGGVGGSNGKGGGGNGAPPKDAASYIAARNAAKAKK